MAAQPKTMRIKAKKMFKVSIDGGLPVMIHPGDVVDVDLFLGWSMLQAEKAEITEEKPRINKDYVAPVRPITTTLDPMGAILKAIESLNGTMGTLAVQKGR